LTSKDLTIVKKIAVPVGSYRAISWEMAPKNDFGVANISVANLSGKSAKG